jgi:hypothetical protein
MLSLFTHSFNIKKGKNVKKLWGTFEENNGHLEFEFSIKFLEFEFD